MEYNYSILMPFLSKKDYVGRLVRDVIKDPQNFDYIIDLNVYFPINIVTKKQEYIVDKNKLRFYLSKKFSKEDIISYKILKSDVLFDNFDDFYTFYKGSYISEEGLKILYRTCDFDYFSCTKIPSYLRDVLKDVTLKECKNFECIHLQPTDCLVNKDFIILNLYTEFYIVVKNGEYGLKCCSISKLKELVNLVEGKEYAL